MRPMSRRRLLIAGAGGLTSLLAACSGAATPTAAPPAAAPATAAPATAGATSKAVTGSLTLYSGRAKSLIDPLLADFAKQTGLDVKTRYGSSSELAAALLEEGKNSPADIFLSQDAGALGAVAARGLLTPLPETLLKRVEERFRSTRGEWVGLSGRARVLAYNSTELKATDLPDSIAGLTDPRWKGKLGWVPTNASFQAFVTALRLIDGEAGAKQWLQAMQANSPKVYKDNAPLVEAVGKGEVVAGLTNHYYLFGLLKDQPGQPVKNHFFRTAGAGSIINVAGTGMLATSKNPEAAKTFIDFTLGPAAQLYFTDQTFEYPLLQGVKINDQLPPLTEIKTPNLDLSKLADLEASLKLLTELGIV